jgi:hypothetical protein
VYIIINIIYIGKFYFHTLFRYFRTLPVGGKVAAAWERLLGVCKNNEKVCGDKIFLYIIIIIVII